MKNIVTLAMLCTLGLALPAQAETVSQNEREIEEGQRAIQKDNADIRRHQEAIETNRAQKAAAKARGDYGTQAKESLAIGARKTAIGAKKVERKIDREMLEEDLEDRAEYTTDGRRYYTDNQGRQYTIDRQGQRHYMSDMSPSAGLQPYHNMNSQYPESSKEGPAAKL